MFEWKCLGLIGYNWCLLNTPNYYRDITRSTTRGTTAVHRSTISDHEWYNRGTIWVPQEVHMSPAGHRSTTRGTTRVAQVYHKGHARVTQGYYMGHTRGTKSSNIRVLQGLPQGYHRSTTRGSTELPRVVQQGYRMGQTRVLQEVTYEAQGCYNKDGHKGTTRDTTEVPSGYHSGLTGSTCIYHKEYHWRFFVFLQCFAAVNVLRGFFPKSLIVPGFSYSRNLYRRSLIGSRLFGISELYDRISALGP